MFRHSLSSFLDKWTVSLNWKAILINKIDDMFTDNMKWLMLVLLFQLLLICSKCNKVINIISQDHLQSYLCHQYNYTGDTTLLLLDTLYNISDNGSMCTIKTNYSLTIQSNHSMATIQCITSTHVNNTHPTVGFAFIGSSSLTLQRVTFIGFGANIITLDNEQLDIINSTSSLVYFTQYHAAVLVFTEINHLVMRDVSISQYYGFAIVAVNLPNGTLDSINVSSYLSFKVASQSNYSIGSGMLFLYKNSHYNLSQYQVKITDSLFIHNYEYIVYPGLMCATDFYNSSINEITQNPVINAAGLTILYTQNDTKAQVNISQCNFTGNIGSIAGAMLVLHLNTITHSQTSIHNDSVFDTNGSDQICLVGALVLIMFFDQISKSLLSSANKVYYPLLMKDVVISVSHSDVFTSKQQGGVYMAIINVKKYSITFNFFNVTFNNTYTSNSSSCIFAASYPPVENNIQFVMNSVKAYYNGIPDKIFAAQNLIMSIVSIFHLSDINNITITGSATNPSIFSFNIGTVILAIRSDITLEGHVVFHNNTGINGGAIMLIGDSVIHLTQGLQANFTNNTALSSGGAIYALDNTFSVTKCTFQVNLSNYNNISVLFDYNTANVAGKSVYVSKLQNCYMDNEYITSTKIYDCIFNNYTRDIYTTPINLTICDSHNSDISYTNDTYPGQTNTFLMAAIDAVGHHSYSIVTIAAVKETNFGYIHINWWFSERENTQVISETDNCTLINVTIHTNDHSTLPYHGKLLFTIPSTMDITVVDINLKPCPPGFELSTGSCICSKVFLSLNIDGYTPNCSINTKTFNRPTVTSWAGSVQVNKTSLIFLLAIHCNYGYCNVGPNLGIFLYNSTDRKFFLTSKDLLNHSSLCLNNREGILCSKCSTVNGANYSVVFGSTECRQCSNWWLLTLVIYAVAGPLLIYLLYVLRLTLTTGTLNGIIFYAQVANAGLLDVLSIKASHCLPIIWFFIKVAVFWISTMNLNLGFPLCFYNGMNELWKAGLSLLFPLYLLTIVVVLIILSHFSLRLSNKIADSSVQVLVTVVHLSFSKLLLAIIDVFTFVKLFNSTMKEPQNVWFNDGSISYRDTNHMKLMIVTSVIVGIFLLPYMIIILTGRLLMKSNKIREYLRPIYEAIHAPYKYNKQYWSSARQLLLIFLYILYTIYRGKDLLLPFSICLPVYFLFVTVQAHLRPFKNKILNLLDLSIMINYGIIVCTNWYFIKEEEYCISGILNITFVYILIFTFSVVVFYHIVLLTGQQARFIGYINVVQYSMKKVTQCLMNSQPVSRPKDFREELDSSFFDDSYSEYREPLISP